MHQGEAFRAREGKLPDTHLAVEGHLDKPWDQMGKRKRRGRNLQAQQSSSFKSFEQKYLTMSTLEPVGYSRVLFGRNMMRTDVHISILFIGPVDILLANRQRSEPFGEVSRSQILNFEV